MKLIIFDIDGTLVDSANNIVMAMQQAFIYHGITAPSAYNVRQIIGLSLEKAVAALLSPEYAHKCQDISATYKEIYHQNRQSPDYHEPLFPNAKELLEDLNKSGYLLGVATGKSRRGLNSSLERHGISNLFVTKQTADDAPSKPNPQMLIQNMQDVGAIPQNTLMIGDTIFDIQMAINANITGIGVSWGCHSEKELSSAQARTIVRSFPELAVAIASLMD